MRPPARWRFPAAGHLRLDNGVSVYSHHLPGQHVASVVCHLGIPADAEPEGCDGIAAIMAACLGTGTRYIGAREFGQRAGAIGLTWRSSPGWTGPAITLEVPAARLQAALDLLRLALDEPALLWLEVTGQIQLAAAFLVRTAASPKTRVRRELPAAIYGDAIRVGRPADGTLATVSRLTPEAVTDFYRDQVRPHATTIVIAGDLSGFDLASATRALGTWPSRRSGLSRPLGLSRPPGLSRPLGLSRPPAAVLVDQPGAVQAQLLLATPAPARGQPGWSELRIAADILGGPITGRLEARLREGMGQSYSLRVTLAELMPGAGLLLVTGAVAAAAAPGALRDIIGILADPLREGFDVGECAYAAEAVTRKMPLSYVAPAKVAAVTADLAASRLPPDFPDRVLGDIAALNPGDVTRAYREHFRTDRLTMIAVGDAGSLAAPLAELCDPIPLQVIGHF